VLGSFTLITYGTIGVVIGFIISYRASGGYERYWLGRTYWSDLVRNVRTMARLIWFHVPPRLTPRRPEEEVGCIDRPQEEMMQVMDEKMTSLDLLEGCVPCIHLPYCLLRSEPLGRFAVSLKHHLRDELGIYYHDLYHLVRPLHDVGFLFSVQLPALTSPISILALVQFSGPLSCLHRLDQKIKCHSLSRNMSLSRRKPLPRKVLTA
jgi:hypothetical protein